ncbi:hypothetical protein D3C79_630880 [compost metagenome]
MQVDQVANVFDRTDLALLGKAPAQGLARHVGAHHEDEAGVIEQAAVSQHGHVNAVGLLDDRDGRGLAVDQHRQGFAQRLHDRGEARCQVIMLVHRELARATVAGTEGGELTGQADQLAVKPLRVQRAQLAQVFDQRLGAVDQLQEHEVGDFRSAAGTRGYHPPGQRFAALMQQAQQFAAKCRQALARRYIQHWRDIAVIQDQGAVGALFLDTYQAQRGIVAQALFGSNQAQGTGTESDRRAILERRVVVAHFGHPADIARTAQRLALVDRIAGTGALERQGQVHEAITQVVIDVQRAWRQVILGDVERCAVRQQAPSRNDGQFPLGQQALVDQQLGKTPGARRQWPAAGIDQIFEITVMLLKVLGSEEHAFRPDHTIVPGHGFSDRLLGGTGWGGMGSAAHSADIEADLVIQRRHGQQAAPLRLIDLAVANHQADLAGGRAQRALDTQLLTRLHQHFVLIDQVGAQGRRSTFGQGEIIGAIEVGAVLQLVDAYAHRRGLAVGARVEPGGGTEIQGHAGRPCHLGLDRCCDFILATTTEQQCGHRRHQHCSNHPASSMTWHFPFVSGALQTRAVLLIGAAELAPEQVLEVVFGFPGNLAVQLGELLPVLGLAGACEQLRQAGWLT